ncbi:MAG: hypothetical protein WD872_12505 [Pirellulaceae bacterium]
MRALTWMICLWPGLVAAWLRGQFRGLVVAVAFAGVLNLALITTFVWPQGLSAALPTWATPVAVWVLVLGFWIVGVRRNWQDRAGPAPGVAESMAAADPQIEADFRAAQAEYLKGHWIEAETLLARLLARRADDVEARLLTAAILRRTGRAAAAQALLTELAGTELAGRWRWEIAAELKRMQSQLATVMKSVKNKAADENVASDGPSGPFVARAA